MTKTYDVRWPRKLMLAIFAATLLLTGCSNDGGKETEFQNMMLDSQHPEFASDAATADAKYMCEYLRNEGNPIDLVFEMLPKYGPNGGYLMAGAVKVFCPDQTARLVNMAEKFVGKDT